MRCSSAPATVRGWPFHSEMSKKLGCDILELPGIYTAKEMERVGLDKREKTTNKSPACDSLHKMKQRTQDESVNEMGVERSIDGQNRARLPPMAEKKMVSFHEFDTKAASSLPFWLWYCTSSPPFLN